MKEQVVNPEHSMKELLAAYPSARRTLFAHFHIGGCQSCAFAEEDSLQKVCTEHEIDLAQVQKVILESHEEEKALLIEPAEFAEMLRAGDAVVVDTRTREEFESVPLPSSQVEIIHLKENTMAKLSSEVVEGKIILFDHAGKSVMEQVSWFRGHGLKNTFALAGGIDRYAQEVDSSIPRYRLELDQ